MSGISYILIIDELHRSICARLRTYREETGAYVCPFGPLISPLAGKVQKIGLFFRLLCQLDRRSCMYGEIHELRTPNEAFFIKIPNFWGLGRQFGHLGNFPIINYYFYTKVSLYIQIPIYIWDWDLNLI